MVGTATTRVYLVDYKTGKVCHLVEYDEGYACYPCGSNLAKDRIFAKTDDELISLIHQGYLVRAWVNGKQNNRRYNLFVDDKQVTFKDKKTA